MTSLLLCTGLMTIGYLLGSIPFGLLITRFYSSVDIQKTGSGNIGATNVYRTTSKILALMTLTGDLLKGFLPVFIGRIVIDSPTFPEPLLLSLIGMASFSGHLFPIYLKWKGGGKGVATAAGVVLALNFYVFLFSVIIFGIFLWITKRVSAASMTGALFMPILFRMVTGSPIETGTGTILAVLIVFRHRTNIKRLIRGVEPPIHRKD